MPRSSHCKERSTRKETKYFTIPNPPRAVGHDSRVALDNANKRKKDKVPGAAKSKSHTAELDVLEVKVRESQRIAFASGMLEGYKLSLERYLNFCKHFELKAFPLLEHVSELFSQFLADNKLQSKTIKGKLSALNTFTN